MKVGDLRRLIEDNYLDDDAYIKFSGVRDGKTFEGYELWTTDDDAGRETIHISIASEGDSDYQRVQTWKNQEQMKYYASKIHDKLEKITYDVDDPEVERLMDDLYNEHYVDMEDLILMNQEAKILINKHEGETA